jgi:hypothetical protein
MDLERGKMQPSVDLIIERHEEKNSEKMLKVTWITKLFLRCGNSTYGDD